MTVSNIFEKIYIRQNFPDFLDLPWETPLENWKTTCSRYIEMEKGRSRHTVVFVTYGRKIFVIKELPTDIGKHEYRVLRKMRKMGLPTVNPVGYAQLRANDNESSSSLVITEYLEQSLPYRSLFKDFHLARYQDKLLDALAILLVSLHIQGVYWGDCSLSNVLFRRDVGELQAYLVDAETSEIYPSLEGRREHDLMIMEENIAGELFDLEHIVDLPKTLDIYEIGNIIRTKYDQLWNEVTREAIFDRNEKYRIHERIQRLNELGFSVDEVELVPTKHQNQVRMRTIVADRNYHRNRLKDLTGLHAEENIAKVILNDINEYKVQKTSQDKQSIELEFAAFLWMRDRFYPTIQGLNVNLSSINAPRLFAELLEHKWFLSEQKNESVSLNSAIQSYKQNILNSRAANNVEKVFEDLGTLKTTLSDISFTSTLDSYEKHRTEILYHIFPQSFADKVGQDGIGDIKGLTSKLDYLKWLGITAIWLAPIYPTESVDFGYDVTDFYSINPTIGTMADFDDLLVQAHELDLKIILTYIPGYTSNKHPWFMDSRASTHSSKRNWYVWEDPAPDGGPPNNWLSEVGGSAWTYDEYTDQYYLHNYLPDQPDLNWSNPDVRKEMYKVLKYWLDKGIDGVQVNGISWIAKDYKLLRDNPDNPDYDPQRDLFYMSQKHIYTKDRPELTKFIENMQKICNEYHGTLILENIQIIPFFKDWNDLAGLGKLLEIPANYRFFSLSWRYATIRDFITKYEDTLPDFIIPYYQLSSHDFSRIASRVDVKEQTRVAAMLVLTLRGKPIIYYGDELGIENIKMKDLNVDPWGEKAPISGREAFRAPMQWSDEQYAGFSSVEPWLQLGKYHIINVETQKQNHTSLLHLYRTLILLRKKLRVFNTGKFYSPSEENVLPHIIVYHRKNEDQHVVVALNFSSEAKNLQLTTLSNKSSCEVLLSTKLDRKEIIFSNIVALRPNEGIILQIQEVNNN